MVEERDTRISQLQEEAEVLEVQVQGAEKKGAELKEELDTVLQEKRFIADQLGRSWRG
jgi:hypothetical protein